MDPVTANLIQIAIRYAVIPELAKIFKSNPDMTPEEAIAKLPADIRSLAGENQSFLDSIRTQAGRG
jgi:hypothetical protein